MGDNSKVRVTIYIERVRDTDRYRIVRVKNALMPEVGTFITTEQAQEFINGGKEVIVDMPRSR